MRENTIKKKGTKALDYIPKKRKVQKHWTIYQTHAKKKKKK